MLESTIDHLVVTAPSRDAGCAFIADLIGVRPVAGGRHPAMATHNALLKLGDDLYLEVIAVDPEAPPPRRARWFGLDRLAPTDAPRLATWVVRTTDIHQAAARSPIPLGYIERMTRGSLEWLITIPEAGAMPLDGAAPTLIQWLNAPHPAATLPDSGCRLDRLEIAHARHDTVLELLNAIAFEGPVTVAPPADQRPRLRARLQTPRGAQVLDGP